MVSQLLFHCYEETAWLEQHTEENISLGAEIVYNFRRWVYLWPSCWGVWQHTDRYGAGALAKSLHLIWKLMAQRWGREQGRGRGYLRRIWKLKAHPKYPQRLSSPNKAPLPNPSQTVSGTRDQTFKYRILWKPAYSNPNKLVDIWGNCWKWRLWLETVLKCKFVKLSVQVNML